MGDFVQQSITKTAVRELTTPIADITTFNTLVSGVISGNLWSCTAYDVAGVPQDPVAKSREGYTARIEYENIEAKVSTQMYNVHKCRLAFVIGWFNQNR